jgi:hypothetical protein
MISNWKLYKKTEYSSQMLNSEPAYRQAGRTPNGAPQQKFNSSNSARFINADASFFGMTIIPSISSLIGLLALPLHT